MTVNGIENEHKAPVVRPRCVLQHFGQLMRQLRQVLATSGRALPVQHTCDLGDGSLEEMAGGNAFYRVDDSVVKAIAVVSFLQSFQQRGNKTSLSSRLGAVDDDIAARRGIRLK